MAGQREHIYITGNLVEDRGTWVVRARVPNPVTGKTSQLSKTTRLKVKDNTKREAKRRMREIVAQWEEEVNSQMVARRSLRDPLFSEYYRPWIEKKKATTRPNTAQSYQQYAEKHILPTFGACRIADITRLVLQDFCNKMLETHTVDSVKKYFVVIGGVLEDAVMDEVIRTNYADYVAFPEARKYEGKSYTVEQAVRLLQAGEQEGEPIRAAITLAMVYGLRRSEVCGLRWKDIDFDDGTLEVCHTVTQSGSLITESDQTKTRASRRRIYLVRSTVPYLMELREAQRKNGAELDKVCAYPDGTPVKPDFITRKVHEVMKKCGLPSIRLHDLRHTAATLLATQATPKQVQGFLGHGNIATTMNIYVGLLDKERRATSDLMDDILKNFSVCSESLPCSEACSEGNRQSSKANKK